MATREAPGGLGTAPFVASAVADSDVYRPRAGQSIVSLFAVPTQVGTVQAALTSKDGIFLLGAAVAAAAGVLTRVDIAFPISGAFACFLRYTNTNATAGSVSFKASDDGP